MALAADTHIQLAFDTPRKDATVGTGTLTLGANEVAIKIGSALALGNLQEIVGTFRKLFNFALTNLKDYTSDTTFSLAPGGTEGDIVTTGHTTALLSLYVDSAILTGDRSHRLDTTFKLLMERLLEEAK